MSHVSEDDLQRYILDRYGWDRRRRQDEERKALITLVEQMERSRIGNEEYDRRYNEEGNRRP